MTRKRAISAIFLAKMHVKGAFGAFDWLFVATARTVVPRWALDTGVVPVWAEIAGRAIADAACKQGPLVADHTWETLRRHHTKIISLDVCRQIWGLHATAAVHTDRAVIRLVIVQTVLIW